MISQKYIILFILTAAAAVIILSALFFVFYKKDDDKKDDDKKDDDKKDDDKTTVKISDSGIYIPDLPTTETYIQNTIYPCDEFENQDPKDELSEQEKKDSLKIQKAWCTDLGIPIGKWVEVVGYSSDPSIDLDETGYVDIYKPDKDTGCLYGEDKKRCVYVQKKDEDGNTIGIENYLGEKFLNNYWNGLEKNSKMKGMYKKEFDDYYEFKIKNGMLSIRPKATSKNCKNVTGEWWNLKPGINVPLIMSLQLTVTYLNLMGYKKEKVLIDMKLKTLSSEKIRENVANEMKILMKGEDTDGPDMCTDDIIYESDEFISSGPPVRPSSGQEGVSANND
jgi:hypothetical protein